MSKPVIKTLEVLIGKLSGAGFGMTRELELETSKYRLTRGSTDTMFSDTLCIYTDRTSRQYYSVDPVISDQAIERKLIACRHTPRNGDFTRKPAYVFDPQQIGAVNVAAAMTITVKQYEALAWLAAYPYLHRRYGQDTVGTERIGGVREWPAIASSTLTALENHNLIDVDTELLPVGDQPRADVYPDMGYICQITKRGIASLNQFAAANNRPDWETLETAAPAVVEAKRLKDAERNMQGTRLNGCILHYEAEPNWRLVFFSDNGGLTVAAPMSIPGVLTRAEASIMALLWKQAGELLDDPARVRAIEAAIEENNKGGAAQYTRGTYVDMITRALGDADANA